MRPGELITLAAQRLSPHGDGLADHDGCAVQTPDLMPGETGRVRIDYVSRQHPRARGTLLERTVSHPARRDAPCPHHGQCSGCPVMGLETGGQRTLKREILAEEHGIHVDRVVGEGPGEGYRWSSKRVVGGRKGSIVLGSYRRGSHDVADMAGCLVDHPDIVACAAELEDAARELRLTPYREKEGSGDLRYVWFKTNGRGQVLVTIVTAEPRSRAADLLPEVLERPAGLAWAIQSSRGNSIRGSTVRPLRGRQSLETDLGGVKTYVGPLGFLQPNPAVAGVAYQDLVHVPAGGAVRGRLAFDLYAGAGVTTALLRRRFQQVVPCEAYPESARALGVPPELTEEFLARQLEPPSCGHVDLVVANPPRGGLGATVCAQLNRLGAGRLHIMSCNPSSLATDLEALTGPDGTYRLLQARAYDTLPQTAHVEVVAWLVARS